MVEAVERCLLQRYYDSNGSDGLLDGLAPESLRKVRDFLNSRDGETLASVMNDVAFAAFLKDYTSFRQRVSNGILGKTAQFWLTYADHIWLVLSLNQAVKTNDYSLYGSCLCQMANLFFSYDGQNYARYLTCSYSTLRKAILVLQSYWSWVLSVSPGLSFPGTCVLLTRQ